MSPSEPSAALETTVPSTLDPSTRSSPAPPAASPAGRPVDLSDPIWTIDHVAAALHLSTDRAREYTYSPAFPAPRAGFGRNLWLRQDVLDWFAGLPTGQRRVSTTVRTHRPAQPRRSTYARRSPR